MMLGGDTVGTLTFPGFNLLELWMSNHYLPNKRLLGDYLWTFSPSHYSAYFSPFDRKALLIIPRN